MTPKEYIAKAAFAIDRVASCCRLTLTNKGEGPNSPWRHSILHLHDTFTDKVFQYPTDVREKGIHYQVDVAFEYLVPTTSEVNAKEIWTPAHAFSLSPFPACEELILISHGVWTPYSLQRKGLNSLFIKMRQEIAKEWGYTTLYCTASEQNEPEIRTLTKAGFYRLHRKPNTRAYQPTPHDVSLWACDL